MGLCYIEVLEQGTDVYDNFSQGYGRLAPPTSDGVLSTVLFSVKSKMFGLAGVIGTTYMKTIYT
ncbi:hypothetical protein E2C01_005473 [Portunus trituberculatus]|uniref:Uncharacterized protein n=1 Tax=Portunus trituberculatus TaxID=210409 RepID=A0A5B7CUB1_PORTR|nr:hypothetical protein [Portunus trituberculatus]